MTDEVFNTAKTSLEKAIAEVRRAKAYNSNKTYNPSSYATKPQDACFQTYDDVVQRCLKATIPTSYARLLHWLGYTSR